MKLIQARKQVGLSDKEAASKMNMELGNWKKYEIGVRSPNLATLIKISRVLGIDITISNGRANYEPLKIVQQ